MAWKLYYDGGCNLCHASKLRVEGWAARTGQPLEVDTLTSDEAMSRSYGPDLTLVVEGQVLTRSAAWLRMLTLAPRPLRWLSVLNHWPATRALAEAVYGFVAANRYRLLGRRACPVGSPVSKPADPPQA